MLVRENRQECLFHQHIIILPGLTQKNSPFDRLRASGGWNTNIILRSW